MASPELVEAKETLTAAERAFRDGDTEKAKNLGYVAHRQALAAQARAEAARAEETKRVALAEFQRFREMQARATREELERAKGALTTAQQEAQAQRQAREAAEAKISQIEGIQQQKSEKGVVLTISGNVLFPSGKTELLPTAKDRLADVAKALKEDNRTLLIVGHTDAKEQKQQQLSEARANAVRVFLVQQGIDENRIRSEGAGQSQPIADNKTAEGRANNRRVEIILEETPGSGERRKEEPGLKGKTPGEQPKPQQQQQEQRQEQRPQGQQPATHPKPQEPVTEPKP
jgi:outer membrane protein OmpA-like peptidoglycan-associated protein